MTPNPHSDYIKQYFTWPQRRSMIVLANKEVAEMNRGSGKTQKIIAPRLMHVGSRMKRSLTGLITPSYKKFFTELIPGLYNGWDQLNYVEGIHYTVGKQGPKTWDRPYNRMRDWSNAIHLASGSAVAVVSQDREYMGVGMSFDYLVGDEARLLDGESFMNRTRQALRGNIHHFGHFSEHLGMLLVTDKGMSKKSRWYQVFKQEHNEQLISLIIETEYERQQLELALLLKDLSPTTRQQYAKEIAAYAAYLNDLRKNATYYHTATALDNIDVIGWENFMDMYRTMDPRDFARSMMNEDVDYVEGGWYSNLDEQWHCYVPATTSYTTARGVDRDRLSSKDSRHDAEIHPNLPLDIALDYGGRINCMAVAQYQGDLLRIDNGFHAINPDILEDLLKNVIIYYRNHKHKVVNYFWDHTAKHVTATSRFNYYEIVCNTFREAGWEVRDYYIGHTPDPKERYEMTAELLRRRPVPVQWNSDNCNDMLTSMRLTRIKDGYKGFRKNKDSEGKVPIQDEVHNPHYGDAVDTLLWGRFLVLGEQSRGLLPPVIIT
jgi:hypothetical protein